MNKKYVLGLASAALIASMFTSGVAFAQDGVEVNSPPTVEPSTAVSTAPSDPTVTPIPTVPTVPPVDPTDPPAPPVTTDPPPPVTTEPPPPVTTEPPPPFVDLDCSDFTNREAAQTKLNETPNSDPHKLDSNNNRVACESIDNNDDDNDNDNDGNNNDGDDGNDGNDGRDGQDGRDGVDGRDGQDGAVVVVPSTEDNGVVPSGGVDTGDGSSL